MQRNAGHQPLEFAALDRSRDHADHPVPAVHGDVVHHVLVAELVPVAHARLAHRVGRPERGCRRKGVLEVFADDGRVRDDDAVVIEHRHLAFRIDRDEPGLVLLELVQVDVHALELQALLLERDQRLQRIGGGFGVVELQHDLSLCDRSWRGARCGRQRLSAGAGGRAWSIATSAGSSFVGIASSSAL